MRRLEHVAAGVEHHVRQFGALAAAFDGFCPRRISDSSDNCSRDSTLMSSPILRNCMTPAWRRSVGSLSFRISASRAMVSRKRGLTP